MAKKTTEPKAARPKTTKRHRDADTGKMVSKAEAEANPKETVTETVKAVDPFPKALAVFVENALEHYAQVARTRGENVTVELKGGSVTVHPDGTYE